MSDVPTESQDQQRRSVLERFRSAQPGVHRGVGLQDKDLLLLSRLRDPRCCARLRSKLDRAGIGSVTKTKGTEISVFIRTTNRHEAFDILESHLAQFPDSRPPKVARAYDMLLLCLLCGSLVGLLVGASTSPMYGVAFFVTAAALGLVATHMLRARAWHGRVTFSVVELLVLISFAAIILTVWRLAISSY